MPELFGERIRRVRLARGLGLRDAATTLEISAAYLSRIETNDEKSAPAERVIKAMADLLGENFDELMTLAGRVPDDISQFIKDDSGMPDVLRTAREHGMTSADLQAMIDDRIRSKSKTRRGR
jgi:transcriptional regulator with XRE-family HTH domain